MAAEIEELDGEATLWESRLLNAGMEGRMRERFNEPVEAEYQGILRELKKRRPDLVSLSKRYQQIQVRDYFHLEVGKKVRAALVAAQSDAER